jgi:hypothetical protein
MSFPSTYTDYIVRRGHRLRFTFSNASASSLPTYQGNVVTLFTGGADGTSQVRIPVAGSPAVLPAAPRVTVSGGQMPNTSQGPLPVPGLMVALALGALALITIVPVVKFGRVGPRIRLPQRPGGK